MKKCLKIFTCVLVIILALSTIVMAADDAGWGTVITSVDGLTDSSTVSTSAQTIVGNIISVLKIISVGVALIMLAVLAMKYMSAAPSDRAEIKKHAVVYVVGAVVMFGAYGILSIIETFAGNIT